MNLIQNIPKTLVEAGIKPSFQRIKILDFLINNNIHPTVDTVYNKLIKEFPTLSKTTVYNTLKLFDQKEIINSVTIEGNEIRYDASRHIHGHFRCRRCGQIFDINYNYENLKIEGLSKYKIFHTELNLNGLCPNCI